jgi:hypothetical protein
MEVMTQKWKTYKHCLILLPLAVIPIQSHHFNQHEAFGFVPCLSWWLLNDDNFFTAFAFVQAR